MPFVLFLPGKVLPGLVLSLGGTAGNAIKPFIIGTAGLPPDIAVGGLGAQPFSADGAMRYSFARVGLHTVLLL
jgi:hypothetical protein